MDLEPRILIVYDDLARTRQLRDEIERTMPSSVLDQVHSEEGLGAFLRKSHWDVVLYACESYAAAESIVFFLRKFSSDTSLIAVTASADMDLAVALMKMGVNNCIPWSSLNSLEAVIRREMESRGRASDSAGARQPDGFASLEDIRLLLAFQTAILNSLPFMAWLKDLESRYIMVNETFARCCGLGGPDQVAGKSDMEIWPRDLALQYKSDDRQVLDTLKPFTAEREIMTVSGRRWADICKVPVLDGSGLLIGTAGFARDISSSKEYEEALAGYTNLLTATLDALAEGILLIDLEGNIVYGNPACCQLWGISQETHSALEDDEVLQLAASRLKDPGCLLAMVEAARADRLSESRGTLEFEDGRIVARHARPVWKDGQVCGRVMSFRLLPGLDEA